MKTRIALFAFMAIGALAIIACAGTPVAVDRFGNTQPIVQVFEPTSNTGAIGTGIKPFFFPNNLFGTFNLSGFNYLNAEQKTDLFALPYNLDASLTVFKTDGFQIKLMPAQNGRF